jgi:hypothetical protein
MNHSTCPFSFAMLISVEGTVDAEDMVTELKVHHFPIICFNWERASFDILKEFSGPGKAFSLTSFP